MSTLSDTAVADPIQTSADATRAAMSESIISPRFYTTDFAAMNRINVGPVRAEFDQMMAEFEGDNNQDHFQRTEDFTSQIRTLEPALQQEFLDFLISSVTSEYSGCVLYNEIRKNVDNPDIKQLMTYLTRDESRHANFINQSLRDFGLGVDLVGLKSKKAYTYFKPKYIYYSLYLSEKIGYARYISIHRQFDKHPEKRFHPIFRWFERWCNDEFRHGEAIALIMRSEPHLLRGANTWWIRFFLTAVYATMYVRDHTRPLLNEAMGMNIKKYDFQVFRITTEISKQVFPVSLDTDSPAFRAGLDRLHRIAEAVNLAKKQGGVWGLVKRGGLAVAAGVAFVRLMLLPVIKHDLPKQVRMVPAW